MQLPHILKSALILSIICINIFEPCIGALGQTNWSVRIQKLIDSGHPAEAIPLLDSILHAEPNNEGALYARATALEQMEQTQKALKDLNHLIDLDKRSSRIYRLRSHVLAELGKVDAAIQDMNSSLNVADVPKEKFWGLYERGKLWRMKAKNEKACQDLTKALTIMTWPAAYMQRGSAEADLHHYRDAIKDFTAAINTSDSTEINRNSYYSLRASAYRKVGDFKHAEEDAAKAKSNIDTQFGKFFDPME
jgi:tetratricopeptide (TPR) repeat protein